MLVSVFNNYFWLLLVKISKKENLFFSIIFQLNRNKLIEKGEGDVLKIAVFDEEHEKDLQTEVNTFLKGISDEQLVDIKYTVAAACDPEGEQLYCFSALILYRK